MRFVYVLLIGLGVGLIVAGGSLEQPPPRDPAKALEEALKRLPPDQPNAAETLRALQQAMPRAFDAPEPTEMDKHQAARTRGAVAALNGFGFGFLIVGLLALLLSLYGTFEKRMIVQRAAAPPQPS